MYVTVPFILPVVTRADRSAAGDQSGCTARRRATKPATTGVDIEVPDLKTNPSSAPLSNGVVAANMATPGAAISGCKYYVGMILLNYRIGVTAYDYV